MLAEAANGNLQIGAGGFADFAGAFDQNVAFAGFGILELAQSQNYAGPATISGYSDAAVLDLTDIQFGAGTTVTPSNGNTLLTVIDGSGHSSNINIAGTGYDTQWYVLSDGNAGTFVVDPNLAITGRRD